MTATTMATMFLVQSDAQPEKFFCEGRWVPREAARRFSLSEATREAMKMRATGLSCTVVAAR